MFTNSLPFAAWNAHFSVFSDTILPIKKKKKLGENVYKQPTVYGVGCSLFVVHFSVFSDTILSIQKNTPRTTLPNLKSNFKRKVLRVGHKVWKLGNITGVYSRISPRFSWGIFGHAMRFYQSRSRKIFVGLELYKTADILLGSFDIMTSFLSPN